MHNKTPEIIKCPFCFAESEHGVSACHGCQATVKYVDNLAPYIFIFLILDVIIAYFLSRLLGEHVFASMDLSQSASWILFGSIALILFLFSLYVLVYVKPKGIKRKATFHK